MFKHLKYIYRIKKKKIKRFLIIFGICIVFIAMCFGIFVLEYKNILPRFVDQHSNFKWLGKTVKILNISTTPWLFKKSNLPKYKLIVDNQDLKKLEKNLPDGFYWTDDNKKQVPAIFVNEKTGKEFEVKIRNRGLTSYHWTKNKKSWRINFKNDDLFTLPQDEAFRGGKEILHFIQVAWQNLQ